MDWASTMGAPFRATSMSCLPLLVFIALAAGSVQAMYSSSSPVTQLDPSNFRKMIKGGVWLVEFYAPWCGHCKSLKGDWEKAAKALKGIVGVAAVDADEHKQLGGEYNIQGFPTIKLMYEKGGSIKAVDYKGDRSASAIVEWAMAQAKKIALSRLGAKPSSEGKGGSGGGGGGSSQGGASGGGDSSFYPSSSDVVNLSDVSFQDDVLESEDLWFVEFFAPWCGHCKALKPAWMEAAKELKGKVKVGAVDCTVSQTSCQSMGVSGYPSIKFFGTNKRRPEDYNGERSSSSIVEFAAQRWSRLAPAPKVAELTEQQQMEDECVGHAGDEALGLAQVPPKQLCLLAFMPDILDSGAAGRNAYISALQKLAEDYKDRPFSYLWVEAGAQVALEANFQVGGAGYPALVAYSPKNGKYASLHSAFEYKALTEFVGNVRQGFEAVRPLAGELAPVHVRVPWDGKDGVPPEEDEFDLADIMNEEL